jgi:hypothetical protein
MPNACLPDGRLLSCAMMTDDPDPIDALRSGSRQRSRELPNPRASQVESSRARAVFSLSKAASKEFSMDLDCSLHGVQCPVTDSSCTPSVVTV